MSCFHFIFSCSRLLVALFVMGVWGLTMCAEVQGSCGDYLLDHKSLREGTRHSEMQHEMSGSGQDNPSQGSCRGPMCRKRFPVPANPAPKINTIEERWACQDELISCDIERKEFVRLREALPDDCCRNDLGVYRPPRP